MKMCEVWMIPRAILDYTVSVWYFEVVVLGWMHNNHDGGEKQDVNVGRRIVLNLVFKECGLV
jgi:hypothetical protein